MATSSTSEADVCDGFVNLLGRSYKLTRCSADKKFVNNVKKQQKDHFEMLKRRQLIPEEEQNSEVDLPPSRDVEHDEGHHMCAVGIESDGGCFSRPKNKKSKANDESSSENESAECDRDETDVTQSQNISAETVSITTEDNHHGTDQELGALENQNTGEAISDELEVQAVSDPDTETINEECGHDQDLPDSVDRDSNDDISVVDNGNSIMSVSHKIDINGYSESEWKGTTYAAECMRLGYKKIMEATGCRSMRKIRGDNYCGLRATSFQLLSQNLKSLVHLSNLENVLAIYDTLRNFYDCKWLLKWSFAERLSLPMQRDDALKRCLRTFCEQIKMSRSIADDQERLDYFLDLFNSGSNQEIMFFEALKLLMLHSAVELFKDIRLEKENVPVFAYLLFARDSSETPEQFMVNHLNTVGDTGGLEQVEMYLLGYALKLTIRVTRPSKVDQEDFISHYPDYHLGEWDVCNLIAEDDRHYNIIVR